MENKTVATWLYACAGLVFAMVTIGAITRLTGSGLSITEWKPLMGAIPPLTETEWHRVFDLYRQSPEFQKVNFWMELNDFKAIFFWEWIHRFLGRLIGLVYALPLLYFWIKGHIPKPARLKLLGLFLLGGAQGAMGWYMVKSGLIDNPAVSHFRLAAHLGLAFLLFSLLLWMGMTFDPKIKKTDPRLPIPDSLKTHLWVVISSLAITICWGAFTAGLDAGLIYNDTFPKMGSHWIPMELKQYEPFWIGMIENHAGVQFLHRWLAMLTVALIIAFWVHARLLKTSFGIVHALAVMALLQMGLGLATLFTQVYLPLAALHQAGALTLLMLCVMCLYKLQKPAYNP